MTLTVKVHVPEGAAYAAEVVETDLDARREAVGSRRHVVKAGQEALFHPHLACSIAVRETTAGNVARVLEPEHAFAFTLGQPVILQMSGEQGTVVGRTDSLDAQASYFVRYVTAEGRQAEAWWPRTALASRPMGSAAFDSPSQA